MAQPTYLTSAGLAKLEAELKNLKTVKRQEVAQRIQQAKEIGGTVDNAEYEETKNEQAFIEGRILTLDNLTKSAVIISRRSKSAEVVDVGTTVTVLRDGGKETKYVIVGSTEVDPTKGKISNVSPIGKALLGKRVGDVAEISAPAGRINLKVVKIK